MTTTMLLHPILLHMDLFTQVGEDRYRQDFNDVQEAREWAMNMREQTAGVLLIEQRNTAVFMTIL